MMMNKVLVCIVFAVAASTAWGRIWTSNDGTKLEAEFVDLTKGAVTLQRSDGSKVSISQLRLTVGDRRYIKDLQSGKVKPAPKALAEDAEPNIVKGFVGRPIFATRSGDLGAGTAFLVKVDDDPNALLVTAQHIFGPPGGLKEKVPREKMGAFVRRVKVLDLVDEKPLSTKLTYVPIGEALDVALFRTVLKNKVAPRFFAVSNPEVGETIWLVATFLDKKQKDILHRGTVTAISGDRMKCKFAAGNLATRGASGGPYLNAKGEVVGLHVGSFKDGAVISGAVLPVESIKRALVFADDE
jgi:S1-C subfamily serine protease